MKRLAVLGLMFIATRSFAQQDPQFTQYMFNNFYYNPAVAGTDGTIKLTGLYRAQWLGYSPTYGDGGAPQNWMLSGHMPVPSLKGGVGAYYMNDKLGPVNNQELTLSYAYHMNIRGGKLSFGVRGGMYSQQVDFSLYRATDPNDPLLAAGGRESQFRPDIGAGVLYRKEKYYVGAGISHLLQPSFDFGLTQNNQLKRHLYVTGGYYYDLDFDVQLQFFTMVESDFSKTSFDVGGLAYFKELLWGGLSFRQSEALILMLGYSLLKDKSLKFGYSLDYIIKDQQAKQPTSHEIMLSYALPVNLSTKKIIRTPRFRY